jgi:hypothetical protein
LEPTKLTQEQKLALYDAYTTIKALIGTFGRSEAYLPLCRMCERSQSLLLEAFPEAEELEAMLSKEKL